MEPAYVALKSSGARIVLVRHAATDPGGRLCGSFDVPLSPAGRAALAALVERATGRRTPDALFTSTLRRATEVAGALGAAWGLSPQPAAWAREIHCGVVEGMPLGEVQRRFADHWARNAAQADDMFAWPGGETYNSFRTRILEGLAVVAALHVGGRVAVVTHAGVISQVLGVIRGRRAAAWMPDRPRPLTATEITLRHGAPHQVLSYDDSGWL